MAPKFRRTSPPAAETNLRVKGASKKNTHSQAAEEYLRKVRKTLEKTPDLYAKFTQILKDFKYSKISVQELKGKVVNLLQGHDNVLLGFNVFLPEQHKIIIPVQLVPTPVPPQIHLKEATTFVNLIKIRFADKPSVFNSFLKVMELYKTNPKSLQEIYQEVELLLKDHPDLLGGFMRFIPKNDFPRWQAGSFRREDWSSDITFQIPQPVMAGKLLEQNESTSKDSGVSDHSEGDERESDPNSKKQMFENGAQSIPHHSSDEDKESLSGALLSKREDDVGEKEEKGRERLDKKTRTPPLLAKEKYNICKPVSELDLSNCNQCTPSYHLLPGHFPVPPSSHRTEHEKSLLNDTCVLVTSGSEDYSFKHMRKNLYEESLFLCEDARFEFDMLVESAKSTKKRIEHLMKKMNEGLIDLGVPNEIEDYLTPNNLRCIEKLYGEHGLDAIDVLRRNPEAALPVLLGRLKQKLKEWDQCCSEFNKVWSNVYAKNIHKSLDHRSFNFKQQETKNLNSKALQAEINEKHEKNQGEDENLLEIGAKSQFPRSKLSVSDAAFGGCNKQHSCIDQSTESIVSSPDLWLQQN